MVMSGSFNPNISATSLLSLRVSILGSGGLMDASNYSQFTSVSSLSVGGSWGEASQPQFVLQVRVYQYCSSTVPGYVKMCRVNPFAEWSCRDSFWLI